MSTILEKIEGNSAILRNRTVLIFHVMEDNPQHQEEEDEFYSIKNE